MTYTRASAGPYPALSLRASRQHTFAVQMPKVARDNFTACLATHVAALNGHDVGCGSWPMCVVSQVAHAVRDQCSLHSLGSRLGWAVAWMTHGIVGAKRVVSGGDGYIEEKAEDHDGHRGDERGWELHVCRSVVELR
jgi:hypothetical protein